MSELSVTTLKSKTANTPPIVKELGGDEVGQFCRAWVNFNGTGTVAIRDSFNVSSITDNTIGDYNVNFTNNMPNTNYSWGGITGSGNRNLDGHDKTVTVSSLGIGTRIGTSATLADVSIICVNVFAN